MSERVKEILMTRDHMDEYDADNLIEEFQTDLDSTLEVYAGGTDDDVAIGLSNAEALLMDYFGLEPDYLMDFLP
jgi:hypothetical protein